jgi:predicted RNase H-like nuclease
VKSIIGIDGCRAGWCVAISHEDKVELRMERSLNALVPQFFHAKRVWIDMPMGLGGKEKQRTVEQEMRNLLKPFRHTSVFSPPVRNALNAKSYEEAKSIQKAYTGKAISIQTWNIHPKIQELDTLLIKYPAFQSIFFESHPEMCFMRWNDDKPLVEGKSSNPGLEKRKEILRKIIPDFDAVFENAMQQFPRKWVKADDILDALILMGNARLSKNANMISNPMPQDEQGIPIRIVY